MLCRFPYLGIAETKKSGRELLFRHPYTKHEGASGILIFRLRPTHLLQERTLTSLAHARTE